ncbi:MAG: amidohydrolase [Acidobacteria bacterium]|nr:MAG: amidohydrolase [Acidobacteriota bacterium]
MNPLPSRRDFLVSLAGLGAGFMFQNKPGRIDVHHHFGSLEWIAMVNTKKTQGYQTWQPYTPGKAIEDMDRGGVSTAMISITTPGIWFGNLEETRRLARRENEYGARMVSDYKGRFGLFAVLPLPDVDASLREIEYAFDTLKAEGVGLLSNNKWLGDESFKPVLDELNRRKAIVYTHGAAPSCCGGNFIPNVPETTIEYNTDVSRTIVSLISSGTANRTPDIRYVLSHGGGTITALTGRFLGNEATAENLAGTPQPNSRLYHLRRFYYDTAASTNPVNIQSLKMLVGTSQIVFGTDHPFGNSANIAAALQKVGLTSDELRAVDRDNALRMMMRK